ncbi:hypothetical protein [Roseibium sp.]|uniref:hypothetical protein n=1 Tax=Roseibium sp. TaxID=1936156 RepID=UPI003D14FACC
MAERVTGKDEIFDMRSSMGYDSVSVFMNEAGVGIYCLLGRQNTKFDENGNLVANPGSSCVMNIKWRKI